jgi:hypothetical protein
MPRYSVSPKPKQTLRDKLITLLIAATGTAIVMIVLDVVLYYWPK